MNRSNILALVFALLSLAQGARAQEEARASWQVTRFDVTADVGSADAAERALTARAALAATNVGQGTGRTFTVRLAPAAVVASASVGGAPARFTSRTEARTKLQQVTVSLPAAVEPGGAVNVTVEYRLPVGDNSGLAAISTEGAQFLPLSHWYPTPNTQFAPRGADAAPVRLTVNAPGGATIISSGPSAGAGVFEQPLHGQPFFLTGRWDVVEGAGQAQGVSAYLYSGASAAERGRAEALIALAAAARSFFTDLFGGAPAADAQARPAPVRLVAVRRGAGFDMTGTLLLDASVFRRPKLYAATVLAVAEVVARLSVGGATAVQGEGSDVVREGLARYLATLFLEKQFGREAAEAERMRMALLYAPVARRDAPLAQSSPFADTYYASVVNKGALVWRLLAERVLGREAFMGVLRREFGAGGAGERRVSLASLRAALAAGVTGRDIRPTLEAVFDRPTDTDLLVGLPQQGAGEWVAALRNLGTLDAEVTVAAVTDRGERVTATAQVRGRDFGEARFKTAARLVRVEVDPEKYYPQLDYANDVAPRAPSFEEAMTEAGRLFAQQQYASVETAARALLALAPALQEARVLLARSLLEQNKLAEAEKEFRAVLDAPLPTAVALAWAHLGLGEIAVRRSQFAEAARLFDQSVAIDADYATALAGRAARLKAEAAARSAPAPDEAARAFVAQLDQAIQNGRKAGLDALIVPGELSNFVRGIVGSQPEAWQTRVLRTEQLGANRIAAEVAVAAKWAGRDQAGTALLILARSGAGWRLADIQLFEVR